MLELAIIVGPEGVRKTQIYAGPDEHRSGFILYEQVLPLIRSLDTSLRRDQPERAKPPL